METRIRSLREDRDLTQEQIAKILNVSQIAYSHYELKKRKIPWKESILNTLENYYFLVEKI